MFNKEDRSIGNIYTNLLIEFAHPQASKGIVSNATIDVKRWISKEVKNSFLATNQMLYPQNQIHLNEAEIKGTPELYPDIPVYVQARVVYNKGSSEEPGSWDIQEWGEITVANDIPINDDMDNPIPGKFLFKTGTTINLSNEEEQYIKSRLIENV